MKNARRRVRPIVVWWTTLLIACALASALKSWQNHADIAVRRADAEAIAQAQARAMAGPSRVGPIYSAIERDVVAGRRAPATTQEVADLLNGGQPVAESRPGDQSWYWTDPKTFMVWELRFRDDVWVGYERTGFNPHLPQIVGLPPRLPPPLYDEVEEATLAILWRGWTVGLIVGVATLLMLPFRRAALLAHVLAGVALVCLLVTFLPSRHVLRRAVPPLIDRLPGILLMIGGASLAMWHHYRKRKPRPGEGPKCEQCGYDLTGNISGVCPECGNAAMIKNLEAGQNPPSTR